MFSLHALISGDMLDYGWGGGRFGKRSADKKRFDLYGSAGRFGRDVDHVDPADEQWEEMQ